LRQLRREYQTFAQPYFNTVWKLQLDIRAMGKPFDLLAEGLISKNSRDNRTGIGLFLQGSAELTALALCFP